MDDLLVGGVNDDEHLRNLEAVFSSSSSMPES